MRPSCAVFQSLPTAIATAGRGFLFRALLVAAALLWANGRVALADRVWLDDLPEASAEVGSGSLGKHGEFHFTAKGKVKVAGKLSPHALAAHAPSKVVWNLDKKHKTFRASVALNDAAADRIRNPLVFAVWGDGVKLWLSGSVFLPGEKQDCVVDLTGVSELKLTTAPAPYTDGAKMWAQSVWLEPSLDSQPAPDDGFLPRMTRAERQRGFEAEQLSRQANKLLVEEKFADLEKLAAQARASKRLLKGQSETHLFLRALNPPESPSEKDLKTRYERLAKWRAAQPRSPLPLLVEARQRLAEGWPDPDDQSDDDDDASDNRGRQRECLAKAAACLAAAEQLEPKYTESLVLRLMIALHNKPNLPRDLAIFEKGIAGDPHYLELYRAIRELLEPRGHGQPAQLELFAEELRKRFPGGWGDQLYTYLALLHRHNYILEPGDWEYAKIRPGLIAWAKDAPENAYFCQQGCFTAWHASDLELVRALCERFGDDDLRMETWGDAQSFLPLRRRADPNWGIGAEGRSLANGTGGVTTVDFANGDEWVAVGHGDGRFQVIEVASAKELVRRQFSTTIAAIRSLPGQKKAVAARGALEQMTLERGEVVLVDLSSGDVEVLGDAALYEGETAKQIDVAPNGKWVAAAGRKRFASLWPLVDGVIDKELQLPDMFGIAYSPDGKIVAASSVRGGLWLWNAATGKRQGPPLVVDAKGPPRCKLYFAGDVNTLVSVSSEGEIRRWDVAAHKFDVLSPAGPRRRSSAVSPDGRFFAAAREYSPWIDLYKLATFKRVHVFKGHFGDIEDLRFSPDGKMLVSGSDDGTARVWDVSAFSSTGTKPSDSAPASVK